MRSFSDQFLFLLPAGFAFLLVALVAAPLSAGGVLAPNVAWGMTLAAVALYPAVWPRGFAFGLGFLQDVIFGTPLGAQALLTLLLVALVQYQARRQSFQRFRIRWLEAAGVLVLWHILLWVLIHFVTPDAPPLRQLLRAGLVTALWYPLFYFLIARLAPLLPAT